MTNVKMESSILSNLSKKSQTGYDINVKSKYKEGTKLETQVKDLYGHSFTQKEVRSIDLSQNTLLRIPTGMYKNLTILNISMNSLRGFTGIETCSSLRFLNASHNQIKSLDHLGQLQLLNELFISQNQLSQIKELGALR
jgi:Leucine-rich repeat (LRR) protein